MSDSLFSPFIRWCEIDGTVFVLDLNTDIFSAVPPSLSAGWLLASKGHEPDQELADILSARGWAASSHDRSRQVRTSRPVVGTCAPLPRAFLCLLRARGNLKRCGLARALEWAEQHREVAGRFPLERSLAAFRKAEGILPNFKGDRDCLPRSLALLAMLRGHGFQAQLKIGLYRYPFDAHAWVEVDGQSVLERPPARDASALHRDHPARTIILQSA